jgi:triphosphoribosyl-dephospho-CoA synthase
MTALNLLQLAPRPTSLVDTLAGMAVAALIDEAMLTPKPGLVDLRGSGAHDDLNWLLMCHSARTLSPFFEAMAQAGAAMANRRRG